MYEVWCNQFKRAMHGLFIYEFVITISDLHFESILNALLSTISILKIGLYRRK